MAQSQTKDWAKLDRYSDARAGSSKGVGSALMEAIVDLADQWLNLSYLFLWKMNQEYDCIRSSGLRFKEE